MLKRFFFSMLSIWCYDDVASLPGYDCWSSQKIMQKLHDRARWKFKHQPIIWSLLLLVWSFIAVFVCLGLFVCFFWLLSPSTF